MLRYLRAAAITAAQLVKTKGVIQRGVFCMDNENTPCELKEPTVPDGHMETGIVQIDQ